MSAAFAVAALTSPLISSFRGRDISTNPCTSARAAQRMSLLTTERPQTKSAPKPSFSRLEANRAAKADAEYRGPQGFTPYAEKVNGRLAMLGFAIGLVTEAVSGKGIAEQMMLIFAPLTHAVQVVAMLPSKDIFFM